MTPLVLPWPDKALTPNARVHWAQRSRAARLARQRAWALTYRAQWAAPDTDRIWLDVTAYPPDNRKRDRDNLQASLKSALDGIADALGVDDSIFRVLPAEWGEPRKGGEVHIRITGGPNGQAGA